MGVLSTLFQFFFHHLIFRIFLTSFFPFYIIIIIIIIILSSFISLIVSSLNESQQFWSVFPSIILIFTFGFLLCLFLQTTIIPTCLYLSFYYHLNIYVKHFYPFFFKFVYIYCIFSFFYYSLYFICLLIFSTSISKGAFLKHHGTCRVDSCSPPTFVSIIQSNLILLTWWAILYSFH